ncbi:MAG: STAS domain-containing protein [candidate division Zixibacteria bacterium]
MSEIKISLDSSGDSGSVSVVRVDGVIDTMTATELEKVMNSLLERNKYKIIVDLGGVDYISSAGWGIFISNIREIRQHSGDIKLARMIPNVYEIFELLEFDSILRAFDSLEKAKGDFEGETGESIEVAEPVMTAQTAAVQSENETPIRDSKPIKSISGASPPAPVAGEIVNKDIRKSVSLESIVLELVSKDPFYSISEIKREIARKHRSVNSGWWKIWGILRGNELLTRKSRFRRARNKTGEN